MTISGAPGPLDREGFVRAMDRYAQAAADGARIIAAAAVSAAEAAEAYGKLRFIRTGDRVTIGRPEWPVKEF